MSYGNKLVDWNLENSRRNETAISREKYFDTIKRVQKPGYCAGEIGYPPTTLKEILPDKLSPDGAIGPSGLNVNYDLDWTGQPNGTYFDLIERIIKNFKYKVETENIVLTNGTQGANFVVTMASIQKGDEVIIARPSWIQFESLCYAIGANIKILPLKEELGWKWDLDELNENVTKSTRMIFICNPNNPTGRIYNKKEIKTICEIAEDVNAFILADEEYRGLELDKPSMSTTPLCNMYYNAFSNQSVSKLFCAAGIRLGWTASQHDDILKKANAIRGQSGGLGGIPVILSWAANDPKTMKKIVTNHIKFARIGRDILKNFMDKQDFFQCVIPESGFLSFPGWTHVIDSETFVNDLMYKKNVRCWPGTNYGVEKHIRLGYGRIPTKMLKENLKLIEEYIKEFI